METQKQRFFPLTIPISLGIVFILIGVLMFVSSENTFEKLLYGFLIVPGAFILLYSLREFKNRRDGRVIIKHDERSKINRLKGADWGFRFLFVSLAILILLNTVKLIDEIAFVALTGPIIAIGITIYYIGYYWFEQRG
ncbi:MAG: hypothetical protein ACFFFH_08445 [Candidatus Thorarchaeota archaeon]